MESKGVTVWRFKKTWYAGTLQKNIDHRYTFCRILLVEYFYDFSYKFLFPYRVSVLYSGLSTSNPLPCVSVLKFTKGLQVEDFKECMLDLHFQTST